MLLALSFTADTNAGSLLLNTTSSSSMKAKRRFAHGLKAQTPLHGHRLYGHVLQFYNLLCTQQICRIAMPETNISTCQDAWMWQIFVRWWWICCTTSCRIVVSSSVGGVRSRQCTTNLAGYRRVVQHLQLVVSSFFGGVRWWCCTTCPKPVSVADVRVVEFGTKCLKYKIPKLWNELRIRNWKNK